MEPVAALPLTDKATLALNFAAAGQLLNSMVADAVAVAGGTISPNAIVECTPSLRWPLIKNGHAQILRKVYHNRGGRERKTVELYVE
jgi:hypothetical protein